MTLSFTYQQAEYVSMDEGKIIAGCIRGERRFQKLLYDQYSSRLFGVCKRYLKSHEDAEEVFSEGMFKILTQNPPIQRKRVLLWMDETHYGESSSDAFA